MICDEKERIPCAFTNFPQANLRLQVHFPLHLRSSRVPCLWSSQSPKAVSSAVSPASWLCQKPCASLAQHPHPRADERETTSATIPHHWSCNRPQSQDGRINRSRCYPSSRQ